MQISEAQKQVDEWIKTIGVRYFNELTNTAILWKKLGSWHVLWLANMANKVLRPMK
jgi:hypothetical protein